MRIGFIYQTTYLLLCCSLLLYSLQNASHPHANKFKRETSIDIKNVIVIAFLIIAVGFRPRSVGADTCQYMDMYRYYLGCDIDLDELALDDNPIFYLMMQFSGMNNFPVQLFFLFIAAIYFICISISSKLIFKDNSSILLYSYLVAFSTYSYGTNGIKAGAGTAVFLLAIAFYDKKLISLFFAVLSIGFHHSMVMVLYAYILCLFVKKPKIYFYGWLFSLFIAIAHIGFFQNLFSGFVDERAAAYLTGDSDYAYMTGFRPDFILYSSSPVIVGYYMYFKNKIRDEKYEFLLRLYLTTNSLWMLCMYASFTNRIAYLSWFLLPIVLLYPFYNIDYSPNQLVMGKKVTKYHMLFTLFMVFVFYAIRRVL